MRQYDYKLKQDILNCVKEFYISNHRLPSGQELANILDRPQATIYRYLKKMAENGEISYTAYGGVSSEFTEKARTDEVSVALVGSIACGTPTFAEENITEYFSLPSSLVGNGEYFLLKASGHSMINAGINDGDLVLIRKQTTADEGQIVVALVDDETTLKRFYRDKKNKRFRLHPENEEMDDIFVDNLIIQGVAIKVWKDLI